MPKAVRFLVVVSLKAVAKSDRDVFIRSIEDAAYFMYRNGFVVVQGRVWRFQSNKSGACMVLFVRRTVRLGRE